MIKKTEEEDFHKKTDKLKKDESAIDTEIEIEKQKQKLKKSEKKKSDALKKKAREDEELHKAVEETKKKE